MKASLLVVRNFMGRIWNDPVGSNIIATGVVGGIFLIFSYIKSQLTGKTFSSQLSELLHLNIKLWIVAIFILVL